jgi:hypothetical protein
MECHCVNFLYDVSALIAGMWKDELQTNSFTEAFSNDVEKKLDPTHKTRKKTFAL